TLRPICGRLKTSLAHRRAVAKRLERESKEGQKVKLKLVAIPGLLLAYLLVAVEAQRGESESSLAFSARGLGLRGRVRSVRSEKFRVTRKNGKLDQGRTSFELDRFDPNGKVTKSIEDDSKMIPT